MRRSLIHCLISLLLFSWSSTASAGPVWDRGTAMFTSSQTWFPFVNDTEGNIWHLDPLSVVQIDNTTWEVNTTKINYLNQYDPMNTLTMRVYCADLKIQIQGWRIGSSFIENKNALGIKAAAGTRRTIKTGTTDWFLYQFLCGINRSPDTLYGLTLFRDVDGSFKTVYIKNFKIYINKNNSNILKFDNGFSDSLIDCQNNLSSDSLSGMTWTTLGVANSASSSGATRICSQRPAYMKYEVSEFSYPELQKPEGAMAGSSNRSSVGASIESAKEKCAALGFQTGTPKFGECVLKVSE